MAWKYVSIIVFQGGDLSSLVTWFFKNGFSNNVMNMSQKRQPVFAPVYVVVGDVWNASYSL